MDQRQKLRTLVGEPLDAIRGYVDEILVAGRNGIIFFEHPRWRTVSDQRNLGVPKGSARKPLAHEIRWDKMRFRFSFLCSHDPSPNGGALTIIHILRLEG